MGRTIHGEENTWEHTWGGKHMGRKIHALLRATPHAPQGFHHITVGTP